jgi:hypothetical protein
VLYDTNTDWTQAHDISSQHPEQLRQFQSVFMIEATKFNASLSTIDFSNASSQHSRVALNSQGTPQILYRGHGQTHRKLGHQLQERESLRNR